MGNPRPANEKQLSVYKEISRDNQAWTVLVFVLGCVAVLTFAFLYCIFGHQTRTPTAISGLLDGLFGSCLRAIIKFHYPSADKDQGPISSFLSKF
jgi:hypothetical protein